jgi:hypothetical protein
VPLAAVGHGLGHLGGDGFVLVFDGIAIGVVEHNFLVDNFKVSHALSITP